MTLLLLPLSRFQVDYEVASGRPFSDLDVLVLRAVQGGANSVADLVSLFSLPPRLLIEIIVTLARSGWVALNTQTGTALSITEQGVAALQTGRVPDFFVMRRETGKIVMECLTGMLIPQSEITYEPEWKLKEQGIWDKARKLEPQFFDDRLDEGRVKNFLTVSKGEWVRWTGIPALLSRQKHWLKLYADSDGSVQNLPDHWAGLETQVLAEVAQYLPTRHRTPATHEKASLVTAPSCKTAIRENDLLTTNSQHWDTLLKSLKEAHTAILVGSAFMNAETLESLREPLLQALDRGLNIDLLWGYRSGSTEGELDKQTRNWFNEIRRQSPNGKLRFNLMPSDSHGKLLIYDNPHGSYCGYVGSYNWLSSRVTPQGADRRSPGQNVSVRVAHPTILAELFRSVAGLWLAGAANRLSDGPDRWRRLAESMERLAVDEAAHVTSDGKYENEDHSQCMVRVVRDQEHDQLMRGLLLAAERRCLITSHRFGLNADIRLAPLEKRAYAENFSLRIVHGDTLDIELTRYNNILQRLKKCTPALVESRQGFHAKVIVADNTAIISSYNYLSADPFGRARNGREIGVLIDSPALADLLWSKIVQSN